MALRIPLHLDPSDYSPEACFKRLKLAMAAAVINPKGFRYIRSGRHRERPQNEMKYRLDYLFALARLSGAKSFADSVLRKAKNK